MTKRLTNRDKLLQQAKEVLGQPVGPDIDKMIAEAEAEAKQMLKEALQSPVAARLLKRSQALAGVSVAMAKEGKKFTTAGDLITRRDGTSFRIPGG